MANKATKKIVSKKEKEVGRAKGGQETKAKKSEETDFCVQLSQAQKCRIVYVVYTHIQTKLKRGRKVDRRKQKEREMNAFSDFGSFPSLFHTVGAT